MSREYPTKHDTRFDNPNYAAIANAAVPPYSGSEKAEDDFTTVAERSAAEVASSELHYDMFTKAFRKAVLGE